MKYILILFLFTSCWDGEINGKKYKLHTPCIESHIEIYIENTYINNQLYTQHRFREICDCYGKTDTIWKN
jgi:hypothetical protein